MPGVGMSDGAPFAVSQEILQRTTCVFGWDLPRNVSTSADMPSLVWQMTPSAGADRILKSSFYSDKETLDRVALTSNSGVHAGAIPPFVMSMTFMLFSKIKENLESQILRQKWERPSGFYMHELGSLTFGILGYGNIGRETARLAKAYGSRVIAASSDGKRKSDEDSRVLTPGLGDPDCAIPDELFSTRDQASFHSFLGQTDVLIVCLPKHKATIKIINREAISKMKQTAVLINIGRGKIVDGEALADALESKRIYGAALDVTDAEPLPEKHRLWGMDNCIITPHIAGLTTKYMERSLDILLVNAERLNKGQPLLNVIDPVKGY